jgi:hypothetical protein
MSRPRRVESPQVGTSFVAAEVIALDDAGGVTLRVDGQPVCAVVDRAVHPTVIGTAFARRERLVAQREGGTWVVLGALRTAPTPGVDPADEYVIRARRVRIEAEDDFTVVSGAASFAVRAYGYVETIADQITSRATSIHKIVGRMLHLN